MNKIIEGCDVRENFFSTGRGMILVACIIGFCASLLQFLGNPGNMGLCVACFERDIAGALGIHHARLVQYLRPEIMGLGLGAFLAASLTREYTARFGSAPIVRFLLGCFAAIGALVFLGCPWRALLRLAGGDGNALFGLAGLAFGVYLGTVFFRRGYSLGRARICSRWIGLIYPVLLLFLLFLRVFFPPLPGQEQTGFIWYSLKGPGSQHAPLAAALLFSLLIGFLAQRSRFCTMGAFRDIFLFRQFHLFSGIFCLAVAAFLGNIFLGQFHPGFAGQPVAHSDQVWNFLGMALAGLAFALAGGCPGRQLFAAGEGNLDAAIFALGMVIGAAVAHHFSMASSSSGIAANSAFGVGIGFLFCFVVGFAFSRKRVA